MLFSKARLILSGMSRVLLKWKYVWLRVRVHCCLSKSDNLDKRHTLCQNKCFLWLIHFLVNTEQVRHSAKRGILNRIQPHHKTVGKTWEMILGINFAGFVSSVNSKIWPFLSKIRFLKSRPFYDFFWYFPYHDLRLKI